MSAFIPTTLPLRHSLPPSNRQTPRCAVDTEAPPASRYAKNYPAPCFEAPYISLFTCNDFPLVNKVGIVREAVPLDLEQAAQLLAAARAAQAKTEGDFSVIFSGPTIDDFASDPSLKYYPMFRRDQVPVIEITPPTDPEEASDGSVTIALGSVVATPPPDEQQTPLADAKLASPWNQGPSVSADQCIKMFFKKEYRNQAPVIDMQSGSLAVSLEMKDILGEPEAPLYPEQTRFMAPKIDIRKPLGEWDSSAFVNLSMEEVQLPLIEAAILNVPK